MANSATVVTMASRSSSVMIEFVSPVSSLQNEVISFQFQWFMCRIMYRMIALIDCRGPSASRMRFQSVVSDASKTTPTLEGEKDKERHCILLLFGRSELAKDAKVVIVFDRVVVVGHDVGERVGDVPAENDLSCLVKLVRVEQDGEEDAANKDPTSNLKLYKVAVLVTLFDRRVGPLLSESARGR